MHYWKTFSGQDRSVVLGVGGPRSGLFVFRFAPLHVTSLRIDDSWLGIGFAYRVITMARGSATLGQRLMSLEFRNHRGERFGFGEAVLHVLLYTVSWSFVIPQVISVITILASPRAQSLYDMVQGTAAINRAAGD